MLFVCLVQYPQGDLRGESHRVFVFNKVKPTSPLSFRPSFKVMVDEDLSLFFYEKVALFVCPVRHSPHPFVMQHSPQLSAVDTMDQQPSMSQRLDDDDDEDTEDSDEHEILETSENGRWQKSNQKVSVNSIQWKVSVRQILTPTGHESHD